MPPGCAKPIRRADGLASRAIVAIATTDQSSSQSAHSQRPVARSAVELGDQLVELFQGLVVNGERAALAVEADLGLEAELGGEVALQRLGVGVLFARRFRLLEALRL